MSDVLVSVIAVPKGGRQIGPPANTSQLLQERADDIRAAIDTAVVILRDSADKAAPVGPWGVDSLEATFSLTLTAEAGVLISKVSAEAAFEITVTIKRS